MAGKSVMSKTGINYWKLIFPDVQLWVIIGTTLPGFYEAQLAHPAIARH